MSFSVSFDGEKIIKALQKLQEKTGNLSPALREIGEVLKESTKQRFNDSTAPDGEKWPENSAVTIERKGRNQPLVGRGTLAEQITAQVIGNDTLEVGSSMEYAAMQQFGGDKSEFPHLWGDIPARPFLGISDQDENEILTILEEYLSDLGA